MEQDNQIQWKNELNSSRHAVRRDNFWDEEARLMRVGKEASVKLIRAIKNKDEHRIKINFGKLTTIKADQLAIFLKKKEAEIGELTSEEIKKYWHNYYYKCGGLIVSVDRLISQNK